VHFARAGRYKLAVVVRRGHDIAHLATECNVEADRSRAVLVWFYVLLPAVAIVLFVIQQRLKMRHNK
jgi:hypothetical protein